jgi:hypothetical protein
MTSKYLIEGTAGILDFYFRASGGVCKKLPQPAAPRLRVCPSNIPAACDRVQWPELGRQLLSRIRVLPGEDQALSGH